jgi:hypothetical protein
MKCTVCGADLKGGPACEYCGTTVPWQPQSEDEDAELERYHRQLREAPADRVEHLLLAGFLPSGKRPLIQAGLHMMPMLDVGTRGSSAAKRLEAILAKLRILAEDEETRKAIAQFEAKLAEHRATDARFTVGCAIVCLALLAGMGWLLWRWLGR